MISLFNAWACGWAAAFAIDCFADGKIVAGVICVLCSLIQIPFMFGGKE